MVDKRAEKGKKKIQTSRAAIERDCRTSSSTPRHPLKKITQKEKKRRRRNISVIVAFCVRTQ